MNPRRCIDSAFSLIEVLLVIAAISAVGTVSYVTTANVKTNADETKLQSDVESLNRAVSLYLANGGTLSANATATDVLAKLKTRADSGSAQQSLGADGSFLDIRTTAVWQSSGEAATTQLRATWNPSTKTFTTARTSSAAGIKRFDLDNSLAGTTPTTETRAPTLAAASQGKWVWDYSSGSTSAQTSGSTPTVGITGGALGAAVSQGFVGGYWNISDPSGNVNVSYVFREAGYSSRLGLFSLEGMGPDKFDLSTAAGRTAFMTEAVKRVLNQDGSNMGKVIIDASKNLVGFDQSYGFRPGDTVAAILIPNASFDTAYSQLQSGTTNSQTYPLTSLSYGDNSGSFYVSQMAGLGNNTYAVEDIVGSSSDNDYNDMIFQALGLVQPSWSATRNIDPYTYYVNQPYWMTPNPQVGISIHDALLKAGVIAY